MKKILKGLKKGLLVFLGFCVLIFVIALVDASNDDEQAKETVKQEETVNDNKEEENKEEAEKEEDVPMEYQQALKSAQSYIDLMGFSYQGLFDQLTSEYADNYSDEAAQYAVDNVSVDWNEEAVEAAQSYLNTMSFSKQGLIDQLTSQYADKFTLEQAQYAVDKVYK